ncbi:probable ATP-dependent RNA helicase DDX49 [Cimex lectularius]|uniref:RNA helicase n=1 Tax=Cimex lectularius TaxID=79782 RepID=A0A8I6TIE7_CIMLE|nr:probable ATP-dependent RNA helicase DDX49 [Cimex lectularius]
MTTFEDLELSPWISRQLNAVGIKSPTPIQKECIPHVLRGEDVIGVAKTGSGKTLAFALPILQTLAEDPYGIYAVVMTPTRELAFQIRDSFLAIGKCIKLRLVVVVGGMMMMEQSQELARKPHIAIATPGRLFDHLNSCDTFHFKKMKYLVLDEADKLLGGQFDEEMLGIFAALPERRQTLMFSATMTDTIDKVKAISKKEMFMWIEPATVKTVDQLKQYYVLCPQYVRDGYLVETLRRYLAKHGEVSMIIFTDTCRNCQLLSMVLRIIGFENVSIHKMLGQKDRLRALSKFKSNQVPILVATDVASRGLDIPIVELVINYTLPNTSKDYIHRVGRTARAGRSGVAITVLTPNDIKLLQEIETEINIKLEEYKIDSKEVAKIFTQISVTKRECEIRLDQSDFYERKAINKRKQMIMDGKDPEIQDNILKKLRETKLKKRKTKPNVQTASV